MSLTSALESAVARGSTPRFGMNHSSEMNKSCFAGCGGEGGERFHNGADEVLPALLTHPTTDNSDDESKLEGDSASIKYLTL